jgi:Plasmid pRiA4b ORF-3-like protein
MSDPTLFFIYRLRVVLNGVSPLVWRRLLVSSKTNLADLHEILQLPFVADLETSATGGHR